MAAGGSKGRFVHDIADIDPGDSRRYGGKATGLARMVAAGLPIPPAFVVSTDGFRAFRENGGALPDGLMEEVRAALQRLEAASGKCFAGGPNPLLVSVRSGAAISMPGMMDTVLNLGLDRTVAGHLAKLVGNVPFVVDTWTRFWRMFADTVLGLDPARLVERIEPQAKAARNGAGTGGFEALEEAILSALRDEGEEVEPAPATHLERTIGAVFESWDSRRAKAYRKHHAIPDDLGTAVTIQAMVFGNLDENSGSGVAFTRNPNTGEPALYGEYLTGRQGEDLVAGTHTPIDLADTKGMPADLCESLRSAGVALEGIYRDAVDIEFTVEASRLYLLQVRPAKRTAAAAVRIAVDSVDAGLIAPKDAVGRVTGDQLRKLLRPAFDEAALAKATILTEGLGSSPGQVHGAAILDADRAAQRVADGEAVILMRPTTSPQDIRGMLAAAGIVTATGGSLSHAAVVSRALDKPCIVGCKDLTVDPAKGRFTVHSEEFPEGTEISIDGTTGKLYRGGIATQAAAAEAGLLGRLLGWADERSRTSIWSAPRSPKEMGDAAGHKPAGLGVVALSDLLIAAGEMDRFVGDLAGLGQDGDTGSREKDIAAMVCRACEPAFATAAGLPVHVRLPRVSSDRAKRLVENWGELAPRLFLPFGAPAYHRAMLAGLSQAAEAARADLTVLLSGISGPRELERFAGLFGEHPRLEAGAMIQNIVALGAGSDIARLGHPVWIDIAEITRGAFGFPTEILEAGTAVQDYVADGNIPADPLAAVSPLIRDLMQPLVGDASIGVDVATCRPELVADLFRCGFRTFAVAPGGRDVVRLELGRLASELSHE